MLAWFCVPLLPFVPSFWITLADYAGISAIVAIGLVVLTGIGGMTSFGQATLMGFGAYTTALLTTRYGISPWLTLPLSLLVAGLGSLVIGAVTLRLSGHYLPLATIAWSVSFYYVFGNLDFFGRNDGISGIPPLAHRRHSADQLGSLFRRGLDRGRRSRCWRRATCSTAGPAGQSGRCRAARTRRRASGST